MVFLLSFFIRHIYKIVVISVVFVVGVILGSDFLTSSYSEKYIYNSIESIPENKVGLVLGTSKYVADGRRNLFYYHRIQAAKQLYDAKKVEYILVSGDNSTEQYNETDTMKDDLVDLGIPEGKIYGDYAGFRTLDSVVRAREIFGQQSYTIITQEFHLERALFIASSEDIQAVGFVAREVPVKLAPRVWLRERLARVKMLIDILFGVEPKFRGESIQIG